MSRNEVDAAAVTASCHRRLERMVAAGSDGRVRRHGVVGDEHSVVAERFDCTGDLGDRLDRAELLTATHIVGRQTE